MNHNSFAIENRAPDWQQISTILLDMDGTLLDKYFDDYFWETYVPLKYSQKNNLAHDHAQAILLEQYNGVKGTLHWSDLNYWSDKLELNIAELKKEIEHLIGLHPYVKEFLSFLVREKKQVYLITAAHPEALKLKMEKVRMEGYFEQIICQDQVGAAKEELIFWQKLVQMIDFNKEQTLFADDTLAVLKAARQFGIRFLIHIAKPNSKQSPSFTDFCLSVEHFGQLKTFGR